MLNCNFDFFVLMVIDIVLSHVDVNTRRSQNPRKIQFWCFFQNNLLLSNLFDLSLAFSHKQRLYLFVLMKEQVVKSYVCLVLMQQSSVK